jgi:hypothetical protein
MSTEPTLNDILVAIARFEAKQDAMMEKLDRLEKTSDNHWKKISEIEAELAVLKAQANSAPKGPLGVILAVGVSIATFVIMVLDRFYVNQGTGL